MLEFPLNFYFFVPPVALCTTIGALARSCSTLWRVATGLNSCVLARARRYPILLAAEQQHGTAFGQIADRVFGVNHFIGFDVIGDEGQLLPEKRTGSQRRHHQAHRASSSVAPLAQILSWDGMLTTGRVNADFTT